MKLEVRCLNKSEIGLWDDLVEHSAQGCLFCQSWWIEASCGANFKTLGCLEGGRLVAGIPLHFVRWGPFRVCRMPRLTQSWGPVLEPMEGRQYAKASREIELLTALAERLRHLSVFFQCFHHSLPNWLPFYWTGFRQSTVFTYILDDIADDNVLWSGFRKSIRWDIRRAERSGITVSRTEPQTVLLLTDKTLARQGTKRRFREDLLFSLVKAARERGAGDCYAAFDADGRPHVADFVAWDRKYVYPLVGGRNPEIGNSGANALLVWWEIQLARERGLAFDFEGSNIRGVEHFFRGFGARLQPFNKIVKAPVWAYAPLMLGGKL